jgi:uncharacterized membrane protein YhaH (DUF805 family)
MGVNMMFKEYLKAWKNSFNFKGRASRNEYWGSVLTFIIILNIIVLFPVSILIKGALYLVLLIPFISLTLRRFHDVGISGWWALVCYILCIILIGYIVIIIICLRKSKDDNKWGSKLDTDNTSISKG